VRGFSKANVSIAIVFCGFGVKKYDATPSSYIVEQCGYFFLNTNIISKKMFEIIRMIFLIHSGKV